MLKHSKNSLIKIIFLIFIFTIPVLRAEGKENVIIFYKEKPPSQKVLVQVDSLLTTYQDKYNIEYYNIENDSSSKLIMKLGLPSTHFPFAIVINNSFTAEIKGVVISFVHFPKFMHGIGRHEGNWSLDDLKKALDNPQLLMEENILPALNENKETSKCDE